MESVQRSHRARSRAPSSIGAAAVDVKPSLYGDVFGGVPVGKWPAASHSTTLPLPSDYAEIFGGFSASCAIPVLDLPPAAAGEEHDLFRTCSALDYLEIFGGLDASALGVSYEDLLYGHQRNDGSRERSADERNFMGNNLHPSSVSGSFVMELDSDNATHLEKDQGSANRAVHMLSSVREHPNEAYQTTKDTTVDATRNEDEFYVTTEFTSKDNACSPSPIITSNSPRCPQTMIPGKQSVLNDEIYPDNVKNLGSTDESICSIKGSGNSQNSDAKQSSIKSIHEDASASEQYHSCSSDNSIDGERSFSKQSTSDGSVTSVIYGEENCSKRETPAVSASSVNFLRNELGDYQKQSDMKSSASENLLPKIYNSQSSYVHDQNSDTDIKKINRKVFEETIPPVSVASAKISREALEDEQQQTYTFSNMPSSTRKRSCADTAFLTVFDINLRTQPSQVPPPSRPPPRLTPVQGNLRVGKTGVPKVQTGESGSGLATNYQMKTVSRTSESETPKQMGKSNSLPFYDVDVDVSSAASASVVAVKEAMEQAEARLKRTKELIARKKDNLQMKMKLGTSESAKFKGKREDEPAVAQSFTDNLLPKVNVKISHSRSDSAAERWEKDATIDSEIPYIVERENPVKVAEKPLHGSQDAEFRPVQDFLAEDDRAEEWKVEKQFFEIISNDKKFKKVHDASTHDDNNRKPEAVVIANWEKDEQTTSTTLVDNLECNDKLLNANLVFATEYDADRLNEAHMAVNIPDVSRNNSDKLKEDNRAVSIEEVEVAKKTDPEPPSHENDAKLKETSDCYQPDNTYCLSDSKEFSDNELQKEKEIKVETCSRIDGIHILNSVNKDFHGKQIPQHADKETPSEFCKAAECKEVLGSVIEEQKSGYFEQTFMCEGDLEEINEIDNYCDPNYAETKLRSECKSVEHLENELKVGGHLMEDGCGEKAEPRGPDETISATGSTLYDEEAESRSKESAMKPEQDEIKDSEIKGTQTKSTQNSGKDSESEKVSREACGSDERDRNTPSDEEAEACSGTEVEKETNNDHCWQYFCEKLIRESKIELHPSEEKQEAAKVDGELSVSGTESSGSPSIGELRNNEGSHDFKLTNDSKIDNYKSAPHVNYNQAGGNEKKLEDAEAHSMDHSNGLSKATQGISKPSNPVVSDRTVPEILKNKDTVEEERLEREIEEERERAKKSEEERDAEREREKDRLAFEKTTMDSHERTFTEARERAERAAIERVTAEARQRALAEAREKAEKAFAEALSSSEKASREARLRAERAAVERANAEARERAAERAQAELAARETRAERSTTANKDWRRKDNEVDRNSIFVSRENQGMKQSTNHHDSRDFSREPQRYSDSSNHAHSNEKLSGQEGESVIRSRARWERHQRTSERAAKALAEKNLRDIISQREQTERNRLSETLDADVRRWSNGKEGNLRALLSTLQYILGPESGWQPVPLTDVITAAAVKKAYRKATLCVHPDKLQQRGANIQQKYICEKVFDLLKEAWNRFNSEER